MSVLNAIFGRWMLVSNALLLLTTELSALVPQQTTGLAAVDALSLSDRYEGAKYVRPAMYAGEYNNVNGVITNHFGQRQVDENRIMTTTGRVGTPKKAVFALCCVGALIVVVLSPLFGSKSSVDPDESQSLAAAARSEV